MALLVTCSVMACGNSAATKPPADPSPDRKDTGSSPALVASNGTDSGPGIPDGSGCDTAPEAGPAYAPVDAFVPSSDANDAPISVLDAGSVPPPSVVSTPQSDLPAEAGGEAQPAFACSNLCPIAADVSQRLCFDFSNPNDSSNFTPEAGTWSIVDGAYQGIGPTGGQITCPGGPFAGTGMTTSALSTLSAADVRVHARLTSWTRPDKVLVLRSRPSGNRIELNFRSYFVYNGNQGGDLAISALFDCNDIMFVLPGVVPIPQYDYQPIDVDVQLRGQRLTASVNGNQVYDDTPTATDVDGGTWQLPSAPGSVGFGAFIDGEDVFDDLIVEVLK